MERNRYEIASERPKLVETHFCQRHKQRYSSLLILESVGREREKWRLSKAEDRDQFCCQECKYVIRQRPLQEEADSTCCLLCSRLVRHVCCKCCKTKKMKNSVRFKSDYLGDLCLFLIAFAISSLTAMQQ